MKTTRHNARDMISGFIEQEVSEENRFEPSRTSIAIYQIGNEFWCCPPRCQGPSRGWDWTLMGTRDDRMIYRANTPPVRLR